MIRTSRAIAIAATTVVLLVGAAACSSGSGDEAATTTKAPTKPVATTETTLSMTDLAAEGETVTQEVASPEHTITLTAAGRFEPDLLELKVGEVVTFKAGKGVDVGSISFGSPALYTISADSSPSFTFAKPGNQTATESITDATVTISVKK